jgi:hypothetical protein
MEAGEVPELVLEDGFWVVELDELGLMRLQFDHMPHVSVFFLEVGHKGDRCWTSWLGKFEHFEHPGRNVAQSLFGHEL